MQHGDSVGLQARPWAFIQFGVCDLWTSFHDFIVGGMDYSNGSVYAHIRLYVSCPCD